MISVPGEHDVTHVEVQMFRLRRTGRNDVDVKIKNLRMQQAYVCDAGLFTSLCQGNAYDVVITIGVTSKLQPLVQLSVMRQQGMAAASVHNPRRPRYMTLECAPMEATRLTSHKVEKSLARVRFFGMALHIALNGISKCHPPDLKFPILVHGTIPNDG